MASVLKEIKNKLAKDIEEQIDLESLSCTLANEIQFVIINKLIEQYDVEDILDYTEKKVLIAITESTFNLPIF